MEIEIRTENENGDVVFEGVLRQNELNFILNIGVNYLMAKGAFPFIVKDPEDTEEAIAAPGSDVLQ